MDELSMTQQVWQPPFIYVPALGGFGVMNFDGEWNDPCLNIFDNRRKCFIMGVISG